MSVSVFFFLENSLCARWVHQSGRALSSNVFVAEANLYIKYVLNKKLARHPHKYFIFLFKRPHRAQDCHAYCMRSAFLLFLNISLSLFYSLGMPIEFTVHLFTRKNDTHKIYVLCTYNIFCCMYNLYQ